jgi:hypothetical protein
MKNLLLVQPSSDEIQDALMPNGTNEDGDLASSFIIVGLDEEDEGSYECCRVC